MSAKAVLIAVVAGLVMALTAPAAALAAPPSPVVAGSPFHVRGTAPVTVLVSGGASGLGYSVQSAPAHGTLGTLAPAAADPDNAAEVTYTAAAGFTGTDSFVVRVLNAGGDPENPDDFADVTATVQVRADAAPTATLTNGPLYVRAGDTVTAHVTSSDSGFTFSTSDVAGGGITDATDIAPTPDGGVDVTFHAGATAGPASFVVHVVDPAGPSGEEGTVTVPVQIRAAAAPVAEAPDSPYETRGEAAVPAKIVVEDAGDYVYSAPAASHGTVTGFATDENGKGATATFVADDGFAGVASFTIRVTDPVSSQFTDVPVTAIVHPRSDVVAGPGGTEDTNNALSVTATPTFVFRAATGTGAGSTITDSPTFKCAIDGAPLTNCNTADVGHGTGHAQYHVASPLSDGPHTFTVRAATGGGTNVDPTPTTISFVVDTTFPVLTIDSGPTSDGPYEEAFAFTTDQDANGTTVTDCRLITPSDADPAWTSCDGVAGYGGLSDGEHEFQVRATDPAGNVTTKTRSFALQATPAFTAEGSAALEDSFGPATDAHGDLTYSIVSGPDHGTLAPSATLPAFSYSAADGFAGVDTIRVRTTFEDGGDQVRDVPVTVHPVSHFATTPHDPNMSATPTWTFASATTGVTWECRLDSSDPGDWGACDTDPTNGTFTPSSDLSEGDHTLDVRATAHPDSGGLTQITHISDTVTIDLTAPDVAFDTKPGTLDKHVNPVFTATSTDATATFELSVDAGDWHAWTSGDPLATLTDGDHAISLRSVDPAGNLSPVESYTWEIDSQSPIVALGGAPVGVKNGPGQGGLTNFHKPTWYYTASDTGFGATHDDHLDVSSIRCTVDSRPTATCPTAPWIPSDNLNDGQHTLHIIAADTAGNETDAVSTFTVDTVPPPVVITDMPNGKSGASATFAFQSDQDNPDATFECSVASTGGGGVSWSACTSPKTLTGLSSGQRTFKVRAIDPAGNQSTTPSTYTWMVKSEIPATTFDRKPAEQTTGNDNVFTFHSDQDPLVTFLCKFDTGDFTACQSGYSPEAAVGVHTLTVQGLNDVGARETGGAVYTWTVTTPVTVPMQTTTITDTITNTVTTPGKTITTPAPPAETTTVPSPPVTTKVCDVIPASAVKSGAVTVVKGLGLAVGVSRNLARLGVDSINASVALTGKGSSSARAKLLAKQVSSVQLLQGSKVVATLKASGWKATLKPTQAGKVKLTVKVNRKKAKALKTSVTVNVLPACA